MMVMDIGGTTTDAGLLLNGFPQLSATTIKIGGVRTNYSVPNVFSIPLGGGTVINRVSSSKVTVGPESVGYELTRSMCFSNGNNKCLTITDLAVREGRIDLHKLSDTYGNCPLNERFASGEITKFDDDLKQASIIMENKVRDLIDLVRGEEKELILILCGGGASLIPKDFKCSGIRRTVWPEFGEVANAVGACTSQISGEFDIMVKMENIKDRNLKIEEIKNNARECAISNGAKSNTIQITRFEEINLAYIPGNTTRFLVTAVGDSDPDEQKNGAQQWMSHLCNFTVANKNIYNINNNRSSDNITTYSTNDKFEPEEKIAFPTLDPHKTMFGTQNFKQLSEIDIEYLAIGCGVLGTGGGGSPYAMKIKLLHMLHQQKMTHLQPIRIYRYDAIPKLIGSKSNAISVFFMGAPALLIEKLFNGQEIIAVVQQMQELLRASTNQNVNTAIICGEIGGCNGLIPLICAAELNLPVIDADFMGRAFPELQMATPAINGHQLTPIIMQDEYGQQIILKSAKSADDAELIMRSCCVQLGMKVAVSMMPLKVTDVGNVCVCGSYSKAWKIGRIIHESKKANIHPLKQLQLVFSDSRIIYSGKITTLIRNNADGFTHGQIIITRKCLTDDSSISNYMIDCKSIAIDFKNENLVVWAITNNTGTDNVNNANNNVRVPIVTVPDLITLFDTDFNTIATEELRYGLQVSVFVLPADNILKTEHALAVIGPKAFGFDINYTNYI